MRSHDQPSLPFDDVDPGRPKSIGRSNRTPGKHALLDKLLGREVGVAAVQFADRRFVFIDLCAGDGRQDQLSETSSPRLALKHAGHLAKHGIVHDVVLVEVAAATYAILAESYAGLPHVQVIHGDSSAPGVVPRPKSTDVVFTHHDPNTVHDWAFPRELVLPLFTTTLTTMGCNAGGLKRLPHAERVRWFEQAYELLRLLPFHHDAILVALNGDAAQFAYLVTGPTVWRDRYMRDIRAAFCYWPSGITVVSWRSDPGGFDRLLRQLFLTRSERETRPR